MSDRAKNAAGSRTVAVRVPASTSNLGSGFDCCGLALNLYLSVTAQVLIDDGQETGAAKPCDGENLICSTMRVVAERERVDLPPVHLDIRPDIPFASGLGSSAAAIAAGIILCSA
ncbi:MAG TPA: hypothetical protein VE961_09550, partial [Pyrinomonadaceae bacterium]|nr:hypothetical protein [Pyrinomonadaceae bacterium]